MKEVPDKQYEQLVHDADDNRMVFKIALIGFCVVLFIVLYFSIGARFVDVWFESYNESIKREIATMKAKNDVLIREIQSEGMTMEEYLKWYEIYNKSE